MDTILCPKGHTSTDADYCSECGARIQGAPGGGHNGSPGGGAPGGGDEAAVAVAQTCPDCLTPREDEAIPFCEICGYNFLTGARGEVPVSPPVPPLVPPPVPVPPPASQPVPRVEPQTEPIPALPPRWKIVVSVDRTLHEPGSPDPPAGVAPFAFTLAAPASLVGRKSDARAVFPEIPLNFDDAVSHRHALLQLTPDGALTVRDIGSSNGTRLNGKDLPAMTDHVLAPGDQITLGHWTRIGVETAP